VPEDRQLVSQTRRWRLRRRRGRFGRHRRLGAGVLASR
jgi:hypothetical protein